MTGTYQSVGVSGGRFALLMAVPTLLRSRRYITPETFFSSFSLSEVKSVCLFPLLHDEVQSAICVALLTLTSMSPRCC